MKATLNNINKETKEYIQKMNNDQYQLLINRTWSDLLNAVSENNKEKYLNIEKTLEYIGNVATEEQKTYLNAMEVNNITFKNLMKSNHDSINKSTLLNYGYIIVLFISDVDSVLGMLNIYEDISEAKKHRIEDYIKLKSLTLELGYKSIKEDSFFMDYAKEFLDPIYFNHISDTINHYENYIKDDPIYKKLAKEGVNL